MRKLDRARAFLRFASVGLLLDVTSLSAQRETVIVTGKIVAEEKGTGIDGAHVYVNDQAVSTITTSSGVFTFALPASQVGRTLNVRARAVGYRPGVWSLRVASGTNTLNLMLTPDPNQRDVASAQGPVFVERAKVPFAVARASQGQSPGQVVPGQADPFGRFLFPPELVMQHQNAIELTEAQRATLQTAIQEAQSTVLKMQWALAGEGEKLTRLLSGATLDESEVLAQVDRVIMIEREVKRTQMTLMIRIRNTLTPAQQTRLRELRG